MTTCKSRRFLVACHPADNKETLTLAAVARLEDILQQCSSINDCRNELKNGAKFYYVKDQAWGFEGRPKVRN
jgi:hypothetical protein